MKVADMRFRNKYPFTASHSLKSQMHVKQIRRQVSGQWKSLFFNHDGVINHDPEVNVKKCLGFNLSRAIETIIKTYRAGWIVNICTAQPTTISEGLMPYSYLDEIHQMLRRTAEDLGRLIARIYYCPHLHEVVCP